MNYNLYTFLICFFFSIENMNLIIEIHEGKKVYVLNFEKAMRNKTNFIWRNQDKDIHGVKF